jgi:uncharacterized protein YbjT (DUF2867 family)
VLERLRTADVRLRTLSRDEAKAHPLRSRSVEMVVADFLKPETLAPALDGVGVVFLVTPFSHDQVAQAGNLIQAAKGRATIRASFDHPSTRPVRKPAPGSVGNTPKSTTR